MDSNNWRVKRNPSDTPSRDRPSAFEQKRQNGGNRGGFDQGQGKSSQGSSITSRDSLRKPVNAPQSEQAILEGRRLYVGNLSYEATLKDIQGLFQDVGGGIQGINISVDPMTGRNPSYCFVDFENKKPADQVMGEYNGRDFLRRQVKIKPATGSTRTSAQISRRYEDQPFAFDRWRLSEKPEEVNKAPEEGRRLFVGGLPKFKNQAECNQEIQDLFKGFNVQVISKIISPHDSERANAGNHYYCFVDLATTQECDRAIEILDGKQKWDWRIKVNRSSGTSGKLAERRRIFIAGLPNFGNQESTEANIRQLFEGYDIESISKLFLPKDQSATIEGNHCYCFVELATEEQADKARLELDWNSKWDGEVRVKTATATGRKADDRGSRNWGSANEHRGRLTEASLDIWIS